MDTSPIRKNKSGSIIHSGERRVIYNVFKYFKQCGDQNMTVESIVMKTASACGVSERTVYKIIREQKKTNGLKSPQSPENKKIDTNKAKNVRSTDFSTATSAKQTSDDNGHSDAENADSRSSQSDSLTSNQVLNSEYAVTSESSRLDRQRAVTASARSADARRGARAHARTHARAHARPRPSNAKVPPTNVALSTTANSTVFNNKHKILEMEEDMDYSRLTDDEREDKIVETLQRLKALIEDRKPAMIGNYNAECERVREERKKIKIAAAAEGGPHIEKRMPKRRFPWCLRSRALLARLRRLAPDPDGAATLLVRRALPLFPAGFVRMPTLLRQADLSIELKITTDMKRKRLDCSQPAPFTEPITTTTNKGKPETEDKDEYPSFGIIVNSFSLSKDLIVVKERNKEDKKEDLYVPPNNIGSITINPVLSIKNENISNNSVITVSEKHKEGLIRVKSPAALNEMVNNPAFAAAQSSNKEKEKEEKNHVKYKTVDTPLHIDTNHETSKKDPSPKSKDVVTQKQLKCITIAENNIPRPTLFPVHHSPTFAKLDKTPPEVKNEKEFLLVPDVDPLGDVKPEPFPVDDSSSDVELKEEF